MSPREQALKAQVRKAQDLIRQFEHGTGRHNSNLAAAGRDAVARVNLCVDVGTDQLVAEDLRLGNFRLTPRDEIERSLLLEGRLEVDPKNCAIGQYVRIEAIDNPGRWASVIIPIGPVTYEERDVTIAAQAVNRFEFERVIYRVRTGPTPPSPAYPDHNYIDREFWKRVA